MKKVFIKLLCLSLLMLSACTNEQVSTNEPDITNDTPSVDRAGNQIEIPDKIETIISMAPSITEVLVSLGHGDKIIAIDTYSQNIQGIKSDLPMFDMMSPDVEQLINLKPDIVFTTGMSKVGGNDPFKPLRDMGVCITTTPSSNSIKAISEDILFIAQATDSQSKGEEIIQNMNTELDKISKIGDTIKDKKTVYFEIGSEPALYTFGSGVFLNEMIELIGAENVFKDEKEWLSLSEEIVIVANPDVILTNTSYIDNPVDDIKNRNGWSNMDAIINDRVYFIDNEASTLANQNIIKALKEMSTAIYPDIY